MTVRIASLVPSATDIAISLGLGEQLVAVTHDCEDPPYLRTLPRLTRSTIPPHASSTEIDALVRAAAEHGENTFHVDAAALRAARPDVILGQTICRVCAVTIEQLPQEDHPQARTVPLSGESIGGILDDIRLVASELGVAARGDRLATELEERLRVIERRVANARRPRVACLEWLDPIFNGGHWVPDQVRIAGGIDVLGKTGDRSRVVPWDELVASHPDVIVLMPCGFDAERALAESDLVTSRPGFADLPAARADRVFAVDGGRYFSRPGPRAVDGAEILAAILHPDLFPAPAPERAARVPMTS